MFLDNINLNLFRVFDAVCRNGSMTKAAEELNLTQSGVSQNIKSLEEFLNLQLFDRIKGRPILTPKGVELFQLISPQLNELENMIGHLMGDEVSLKGQINLGVPIEYGNTFVLPLAAKFGSKHKKVSFEFIFEHASKINEMLISGKLDLAVADSFAFDNQIETVQIDNEEIVLCTSLNYFKRYEKLEEVNERELLKKIEFIGYLNSGLVLQSWFNHHFPKAQIDFSIKATAMNVQSIVQLIMNDVGAGILPLHVIKKFQKRGEEFYLFKGKGVPLLNKLSLAYVKGRTRTPAVDAFKKMLMRDLANR